MRGDDITADEGCGAHCAVRQGSSSNAGSATGKFWGSREHKSAQTIAKILTDQCDTLCVSINQVIDLSDPIPEEEDDS
jgi:hypothetical protein